MMGGKADLNDVVIKVGEILIAFDPIFSQHFHIIWYSTSASAS
jgi:hypothetical protein